MPALRPPLLLLATALALAACASGTPDRAAPGEYAATPDPEPTPMPRAPEPKLDPPDALTESCTADAAAWAVGELLDTNLIERIRVDTKSASVRVLRPGMMATMDYRGDRVNIDVDGDDRVTGIRCG